MNPKNTLYTHRMKAFSVTLTALEMQLQTKIRYVEAFAEVYQFPKNLTKQNLRKYKRWLKAAQQLKDINETKI